MTNDMSKKPSIKETDYPWENLPELQKEETVTISKVIPQEPEPETEPEPEAPAAEKKEEPKPEAPLELTKAEKEEKEIRVKKYMHDRVLGDFTQQELDVMQSTIASGTNKEEFRLFVQTCVNTNLNPFLNHIYPIVFEGKNGRKLNLQISVEGIMFLARKVPGYKGVDVQLVHENDEFRMSRVNGAMKVVQHEFGFPRGQVVGGYAIARREGFEDAITVMERDEVKDMTTGRNANMWKQWFNDMFKKHILKRAAKEQYGIEVTEEPMATTPSVNDFGNRETVSNEKRIETGDGQSQTESEVIKGLWASIFALSDEKGMNVMEMDELIINKFPGKSRDDLNAQQLAALQKFVQFFKREEPKKDEVIDIEFDEVGDQAEVQEEAADEFEAAFD